MVVTYDICSLKVYMCITSRGFISHPSSLASTIMSLQCLPLLQSRPLLFSGNHSATRSGLLPEYPPGCQHNLESDPKSDQHFHFTLCRTPVEVYENTISPIYQQPHTSTPFNLSGDFQADDKDTSSEPTSSHKEDEAWADYIDSSGKMVSLSGKNPGHIITSIPAT